MASYVYNSRGQVTQFTSPTGGSLTTRTMRRRTCGRSPSRPTTTRGPGRLRPTSTTLSAGDLCLERAEQGDDVHVRRSGSGGYGDLAQTDRRVAAHVHDYVRLRQLRCSLGPGLYARYRPELRDDEAGYYQYEQLVRSVDGLTNTTEYTYTKGLLSSIRDANNNVTSYTYDLADRLRYARFADGTYESYLYYADNSLSQKTDRKNQFTSYTYDAFKRIARTDPEPTSLPTRGKRSRRSSTLSLCPRQTRPSCATTPPTGSRA